MSVPADPDQWAIRREEGSSRLILIARHGDEGYWWDVAEFTPGNAVAELVLRTMNSRNAG